LKNFSYRIDPMHDQGRHRLPADRLRLDARVTGKDGVAHDAVIRVNHPYDVDGTLIYQATYGFAIDLRLTKDGRPSRAAPTSRSKRARAFRSPAPRVRSIPRFVGTIDRATGQPAADPRPNDPGVVIQAFDGDARSGTRSSRSDSRSISARATRSTPVRYVLYSGFQYRYDPGIPLVGIGAFVLLGRAVHLVLFSAGAAVRDRAPRRRRDRSRSSPRRP
jgi:hypothetical protein